jgi:metal-responsive CopG/Arc/MetJ family transcriptional regulator
MKTIRIELNGELFEALDRAARETGRSRATAVQDALWEHLLRRQIQSLEERDRVG